MVMPPSAAAGPNAHLVGDAHGRLRLDTPALILDLDAVERNVARMAEIGRATGLAIRPHVKCHKSARIADIQLAAGASGFCCATLGEAEMMARAGFSNILITSPVASEAKIARAVKLAELDARLCLVVDSPANATRLSGAFRSLGRTVDVLVDVDPGMQRTGAATQKAAISLAQLVEDLPGLNYLGLQCYAGHVQHIADPEARQDASLAVMGALKVLCEELKALDLPPRVVSGGGTGTHAIDSRAAVLTELQVGSYVVMDRQYEQVWASDGGAAPFEVALFVQSSVVSNNHPQHITCDAGFKHFAVDGGTPRVASGLPADCRYDYFGDEHGRVLLPAGAELPELGARVEFVTPHCDPTINLYDQYHCVRGTALVDIWPVDARGR